MGIDPYDENGEGSYAIYDTVESKVISSGSLEVLPNEPIMNKDGWEEYKVKLIKTLQDAGMGISNDASVQEAFIASQTLYNILMYQVSVEINKNNDKLNKK